MFIDECHAVRVAVHGHAERRVLGQNRTPEVPQVLHDQRIRVVMRERPVQVKVEPHELARKPLEDRGKHLPVHPVPDVDDDLHRPDVAGEGEDVPRIVGENVAVRDFPLAGGGREIRFPHHALDLAQSCLVRDRHHAFARYLKAVIFLGVVACGHHHAARIPVMPDGEVVCGCRQKSGVHHVAAAREADDIIDGAMRDRRQRMRN